MPLLDLPNTSLQPNVTILQPDVVDLTQPDGIEINSSTGDQMSDITPDEIAARQSLLDAAAMSLASPTGVVYEGGMLMSDGTVSRLLIHTSDIRDTPHAQNEDDDDGFIRDGWLECRASAPTTGIALTILSCYRFLTIFNICSSYRLHPQLHLQLLPV